MEKRSLTLTGSVVIINAIRLVLLAAGPTPAMIQKLYLRSLNHTMTVCLT